MRIVKGPDFPTGGLIMGDDGIKDAYRTGRGTIRVRARHEIEESRAAARRSCSPRCRSRRASTRSRASSPSWSRPGKIDGVRDIRNESGQGKTRLVIELRADANPQIVLNNLFKHTAAQSTFPVNMVALVDGVPRTVNLQEALQAWVDHQVVVLTRRTQFRLEQAEARLHIVEGLAEGARHDRRDRQGDPRVEGSRPRPAPRSMGKRFGFSEIQANHILDMTLGRLTQLGRDELANEKKELDATIKELRRILAQRDVLMGVIREELVADPRRAQGAPPHRDRSRRHRHHRRGRARRGRAVRRHRDRARLRAGDARAGAHARKVANAGERDAVAQVIETSALAGVLFFTDRGRAYRATVHDLPKERLTAAQNLFQFGDGERLVAVLDARLARRAPEPRVRDRERRREAHARSPSSPTPPAARTASSR